MLRTRAGAIRAGTAALSEGPVGRGWRTAVEIGRRRDVATVLLALALVLAGATYVRNVVQLYEGDWYIYWSRVREPQLYITALGEAPHGYLYSPAFVQAIWPILMLPKAWFYAIWLALGTMTLVWMLRPFLTLATLPWVFVTFGIAVLAIPRHSLSSMNVTMFMGIAVAAGFRWPWTWSLILLTKVTPGLGLLWFVVRREWRSLAIALGFTLAVCAVSFVIAPSWWFDWVTVIRNNSQYPEPDFAIHFLPLIPRLIIAAAMIVVAARYDAKWVMPIAVVLAMPYISDTSLIALAAVPPLLRRDTWTEPRSRKPAAASPRTAAAANPA
jgi:hypothetical protein